MDFDLGMGKKLQLLKFANLTSKDITPAVITEIASVFDYELSDSTISKMAELIKLDDGDTLADWIGSPTNLGRLKALLSPEDSEDGPTVVLCPHCQQAFALD